MTVDTEAIRRDIARGMIPAHVYSDPDVFELERERLFGRAWVFLAHESEVPSPGDYVVRRIVDDSFIVVRDEAGMVRVHFNMCLHRGMQVCRAELGNASHFRCPYHAWSYRNDGRLAGLPFHEDAYGGERRPAPRRATPAAGRRASTRIDGLVFVSLAAGRRRRCASTSATSRSTSTSTPARARPASSCAARSAGGCNANWKIGCENFVGDMYHTPHTHRSVVDIGLFREPKAHKRKEGALYFAGAGRRHDVQAAARRLPRAHALRRLPRRDDRAGIASAWTPEQVAMVADDGFMVSAATAFPNLSFVHNWPQVDDAGDVVPFISLRQWQPVSATETEVLSWFAVDREAPEDFKRDSYRAYLMCFGSSGMFEQDDVENWVSITTGVAGRDGPPAAPQQPDGADVRRRRHQPAPARLLRARRAARRLRRVQPARLADDVGEPPRRRTRRAAPTRWAIAMTRRTCRRCRTTTRATSRPTSSSSRRRRSSTPATGRAGSGC